MKYRQYLMFMIAILSINSIFSCEECYNEMNQYRKNCKRMLKSFHEGKSSIDMYEAERIEGIKKGYEYCLKIYDNHHNIDD
jgi:hypothetical protein